MKNLYVYGLLIVILVCFASPILGQEVWTSSGKTNAVTVHIEDYGEQLGTVRFPVSCNEAASQTTKQGLALLHHMTYKGARDAFAAAIESDSDCAMGYWGQAMTFIHPLWSDPPSKADFKRGKELVKKARTRGRKTEWEQAYIDAVDAYYAGGWNRDEKPNLTSFEKGWEKVYRRFPKDSEAACFYALAHMATSDPGDKTYAKQKQAATIAKKVLAQIPDHPGAHHYIIHAYDYPELADKALVVARSYGQIAPEVPHALHMPTHIFTRLGLWQESITMNKRSADAALKHPAGKGISLHFPHALDYLVYAYLQRGEDKKAREVLDTINKLEGPYQVHIAAAYTFAAVPARLVLERQDWSDAALLEPRTPKNYPWGKFPAMEAITHFARALGATRSGNKQAAAQALVKLTALREQTEKTSAYWAKQVEIQHLSALAWLKHHEGMQDEALEIMQSAAGLEATTEKHPVTPGEVLPARELLADMLLDMGRYKEAQSEYEAALERSTNRFNSLYGAGRAAELGGNKKQASFYYKKLVEITANYSNLERSQKARTFLAEN
jgi:tetratricopeptide (TPR) repeat protein